MPHVDLDERRKCKREYKARLRARRREEYKAPAPSFNVVERKRKPIVHQYNLYPPLISLATVNILTLEEIEAKYGKLGGERELPKNQARWVNIEDTCEAAADAIRSLGSKDNGN